MTSTGLRLRAILAELAPRLGASDEDLAFVDNATTGVSTVLRHLDLRAGDRLVTTTHVYGAVRNALRYVAGRVGAVVDEVAVPFPLHDPAQVVDAVRPHLAGARLAVFDHITSPTGLVLPIAELVAACRGAGVPVLVDAAHAPGQVPVHLDALGADWVTGNLHKWMFAPKGTAFLWTRRDQPERKGLVPLALSHELARGFPEAFDWTGTRDLTGWLAVPAALAFIDALGADAVRAHNDALCAVAAEHLARRWGVSLPSPPSMRAAMAALPAPGDLPEDRAVWLHDALRERRIEVPCIPFAGRTWVRISAQVYNTPPQYARLADAVLALVG